MDPCQEVQVHDACLFLLYFCTLFPKQGFKNWRRQAVISVFCYILLSRCLANNAVKKVATFAHQSYLACWMMPTLKCTFSFTWRIIKKFLGRASIIREVYRLDPFLTRGCTVYTQWNFGLQSKNESVSHFSMKMKSEKGPLNRVLH